MARSLASRTFQLRAAPLRVPADEGAELGDPGARRDELDDGAALAAAPLAERFDRRGTEPFELFRSEFGQNSWNRKKTTKNLNHFIEGASDPKGQNPLRIEEILGGSLKCGK